MTCALVVTLFALLHPSPEAVKGPLVQGDMGRACLLQVDLNQPPYGLSSTYGKCVGAPKARKTLIRNGYRSLIVNPELRFNAHHRNLSAAGDSGDDRNLRSGRDRARESTCISDILVPNKNIDMLPHLSLFGYDAISNSGVLCPER